MAANTARETVHEASPAVIWLGRFGFAAKGVAYVLIGVVAARVALGVGGAITDSQGVLQHIVEMPFGNLLLLVLAIGLAGYTLWRIVQALLDTEHKGTELKGLWARGGYLISAGIYATLTLTAARMLVDAGAGAGSGEGKAQDWTARLIEQPFGPWLVALVGLCLLSSAGFQFFRAATADFRKRLQTGAMSAGEQDFAIAAGRFGHVARGITFGIMGLFLMLAAFRHEPGEAKGLAGALHILTEQPFGPQLLGIVAGGLVLYGLYMFVESRYRRMVLR